MELTATGLTHTRGGRTLLDGVDLRLDAGTITAITGPSGAGKSTLLAVVGRLQPPDLGIIRTDIPPSRTSYVLQSHALLNLLTAAENVEIALTAHGHDARAARAIAAAALDDVGLTAVADHLVEALSGGQQQRVAIARALATAPALLIADEPTAELDATTRDRVLGLAARVATDGGITVIASHDAAVTRIADRVLELHDGRLSERR